MECKQACVHTSGGQEVTPMPVRPNVQDARNSCYSNLPLSSFLFVLFRVTRSRKTMQKFNSHAIQRIKTLECDISSHSWNIARLSPDIIIICRIYALLPSPLCSPPLPLLNHHPHQHLLLLLFSSSPTSLVTWNILVDSIVIASSFFVR